MSGFQVECIPKLVDYSSSDEDEMIPDLNIDIDPDNNLPPMVIIQSETEVTNFVNVIKDNVVSEPSILMNPILPNINPEIDDIPEKKEDEIR